LDEGDSSFFLEKEKIATNFKKHWIFREERKRKKFLQKENSNTYRVQVELSCILRTIQEKLVVQPVNREQASLSIAT